VLDLRDHGMQLQQQEALTNRLSQLLHKEVREHGPVTYTL
jgi:hypothetical protein